MKQGDYVTRKSYQGDVVFRIERVEGDTAILRGVEFRLLADAPLDDLVAIEDPFDLPEQKETRTKFQETLSKLWRYRNTVLEKSVRDIAQHLFMQAGTPPKDRSETYFEVPGKVLHLDGDSTYLRKSMELYGELRVPAEGHYIEESAMSDALYRLLPRVRPNIVVITGHDGLYKGREDVYAIANYKNSHHFVEAIRTARAFERNLDGLIIIAGACQSHFEALLQAGANFASSPARILIHAMDPVQIASKVAYTSFKDTVSISDVIEHTMTGYKGMGGIETRGCFRIGVPYYKKT